MTAGGKKIAEAKVDDFDITSLPNENVFDFEVAVNDAISVTIIESACDLSTEFSGLLFL